MKQPIKSGFLAFLAAALFIWGCNSNGSSSSSPSADTASSSKALTFADLDSTVLGKGKPIHYDEVKNCLDTFLNVMNEYNITKDSVPQPVKKCPEKTYFVTAYESFRASDLNHYIDSVINKHDSAAQGANLDIHMSFGVVTNEFVKDHPEAATMLGRIVIFVIPRERHDTMALKSIAAGQTSNPNSAYEIGGLAP